MVAEQTGTATIDYEENSALRELPERTAGRGPDHFIQALVTERHTDIFPMHVYDKAKQMARWRLNGRMRCGKASSAARR